MYKTILVSLLFLLSFIPIFSQNDSITFLALGDSYTEGTGEVQPNGWPAQLVSLLNKKKKSIASPKIVAKVGWTTTDLITHINSEDLQPPYDLVSLLIGVNNQYQGLPLDTFKAEFPALLETAIRLANNNPDNVFVLSIPDYSVTPYARFKDKKKIAQELETYNSIIEDVANQYQVQFIEITELSQKAAFNRSLIASDSLHPSGKMYKTWAKKIVKKRY
ncbi:SGNH/GDSL hydrolase family protein [Flagellimonas olearia]|uniref:SGNH/GDSL hydrolase family protein n=1 Tax=Flagellimonas olearia TaxID=552546 RepID=A0A6I1DWQ3_9FLAO|nr:SGNH/GDSL hydrolase family protein [Allomuricauda olearia]KAB7529628.1 SGNH/GDSL hydrolase family protein [Allomuricauda olearia]